MYIVGVGRVFRLIMVAQVGRVFHLFMVYIIARRKKYSTIVHVRSRWVDNYSFKMPVRDTERERQRERGKEMRENHAIECVEFSGIQGLEMLRMWRMWKIHMYKDAVPNVWRFLFNYFLECPWLHILSMASVFSLAVDESKSRDACM